MKKLLILVLLLTVAFVGCDKDNNASDNDLPVLKVGMELKYPPFETIDTDGNPDGVSVKLAEALGEYLGREVVIVETAYPSLITALQTGKVDIIISSMTINATRAEVVDFSDPYTTSDLMMLVHKDSIVKSYEDLNNPDVTIVSKTGTIGALWAAENAPLAKIKNVAEEASAVLEVSQGKSDVFIYDPLAIINHNNNYPDSTIAVLQPLPNTSGWGIALQKGEDELREQINAFLKEAKEDGTFQEIRDNYLQDKIKEFESYGLEFFF